MSNRLILCEGFDDAYILGYYLFKTLGWKRNNNITFSEYYKPPRINKRNQSLDFYEKDDEKLAIWAVGGKDHFSSSFKFIKRINDAHAKFGIKEVFLFSDRDDSDIDMRLKELKYDLSNQGIITDELKNQEPTYYPFSDDLGEFSLKIVPVIIPFDCTGAIETLLMNAIAESSDEDSYVVHEAEHYIENIKKSGKVSQYLFKDRLILKAKYSAVIAVTNPERSTATYDKLLMAHNWEEKETIKLHLNVFDTYL